jgi:FkbM family methyltransferase
MKDKFLMYSQEYEDWILHNAFFDIERGFYIDVGANDPWHLSVTKIFYDRGWCGINIEPLCDKYEELCKDRPKDINLNIGAGNVNGELEFYIADMGTTCDVATINDDKWGLSSDKKRFARQILPVMTLTDILDKNIADPNRAIHFCKIDVEGFERAVLEGLNFDKYRPLMFVMEATIPGTSIPCHEKWEDLLFDNNYQLCHVSGINRYYLDSQSVLYDEMRRRLASIVTNDPKIEFYRVVKVEGGTSDASGSSRFKQRLKKILLWLWRRIP